MKPTLTTAQFAQLRAVLGGAAGLVFDDSRRDSMAYSVAERLRATGLPDVASYLMVLGEAGERQALLDEVTIQETYFFRNPPQVRALRQHVLPELIRHADGHGRRLRIWSAGCSTGEEAYGVAMLLRELLPGTAGWDVKVVATDVSERALAAARTARYGPRAVHLAAPEDLARFFTTTPDGQHEVRPEVRELVELRHHNLVTEPVPFGPGERIDLVLCRNVTIYFGRDTTRALMGRLHALLRDGGFLLLGHSETLWRVSEDFRLVPLGTGDSAAFVYRRLDGPERRSVLPDRRTLDEGPRPPTPERRVTARRDPSPPPPADGLLTAARAALSSAAYDEAALLAGQAAAADPLRAEARYLRGLALVDAGRDAEALVDLRKAVYLEPSSGFAHFLLAGALERLGDRSAAAREYAAAAETLGSQAGDVGAVELGGPDGRSVGELIELCRTLARVDHKVEGVR